VKIASSQYSFTYGSGPNKQLHYPYSLGTLLAYATKQRSDLDILPSCILRDDLRNHVELVSTADVLLGSCYVWNREITTTLAREAKLRNPSLRVIFGGPQVPDDVWATGFFQEYPFVDTVVHGEGEASLVAALGPRALDREIESARIQDLDRLPSPYTSGMIDRLISGTSGVKWVASWETNRGCPYQCTFCDWGSATYTMLRQYPLDRLWAEIDWFADNNVGYIDCCDANFGILPRDLGIARRLKEVALSRGAPNTFRQSWAKNSSERVIAIAQELKAAGLLTAVGLAVQSLDDDTLEIIKRKNLPFGRFSDLSAQFAAAGLPTLTEVIRGLPGETLESFKMGLGQLANGSQISNIYIFNCAVLPNAPMASPDYRSRHKIETVRSPIYLAHTSIHETAQEFEEIVISTATMNRQHMHQAFMFSWAILLGESLGMLKVLRRQFGDAAEFYDRFLQHCSNNSGKLGLEHASVSQYAKNGYEGRGWSHHDPSLGDVYWPIEEASWLRLRESPDLRRDLAVFADSIGVPESHVDEQIDSLTERPADVSLSDWARETMWYGRRRKRHLKNV